MCVHELSTELTAIFHKEVFQCTLSVRTLHAHPHFIEGVCVSERTRARPAHPLNSTLKSIQITHESHALSMPLYFKRSYLKIQLNSELSIFLFLPSNPNPNSIPFHPIPSIYHTIRIYLFCVCFLFIRNFVFLVIHLLRISYASTKNTNSYLISREHLGLDNTILMT